MSAQCQHIMWQFPYIFINALFATSADKEKNTKDRDRRREREKNAMQQYSNRWPLNWK